MYLAFIIPPRSNVCVLKLALCLCLAFITLSKYEQDLMFFQVCAITFDYIHRPGQKEC